MDYQPAPIPEAELALMRRIDRLHLDHPDAGSRTLRDLLRLQGLEAGRRHVDTLMRRMGIQALYRKPDKSRKHPAHAVFPYALGEAAARCGAPEIVNTDQGSPFSGAEFVAEVARIGARQRMDGRGCWRDNTFVERGAA